ncbi:K1324 protein, partial [Psophia crepitans]|nr:K1324 protein [Psophia crepitans]
FSCKAGEFLDMKAQACKPCAEGTYSLGTGVRFDEWDEVPHGFANVATNLEVDDGFGDVVENCTASTWVPLGDYVASNTDECTATLMYAVNLKQSGTVSFEYIYPDSSIVFEFFVGARGGRVGVGLEGGCRVGGGPTAPPQGSRTLSSLPLPGVAYTSECFPCKPGTYAPAAGSSACQLCPADTFSSKGATACQPCEPHTYAGESWQRGVPHCPLTQRASRGDSTQLPPLLPGQTQLMFKWAEPKICSEELPQAAKLPPSGVKTKCPPCNPGF